MSVHQSIQSAVFENINLIHVEIENESYKHAVPKDSETHFRVLIVSEQFSGQSKINRYRTMHSILSDAFSQGLHALTMHLYTPDEWHDAGEVSPLSPPCLGGGGR